MHSFTLHNLAAATVHKADATSVVGYSTRRARLVASTCSAIDSIY